MEEGYFKSRKWLLHKKIGPSGGRGTECREDESRGVNRGHVPVGFQKDRERFIFEPLLRELERI